LKKKNKTPLFLRIIPVIFPWLEKLAPSLANRFFVYIFFSPVKYRVPDKERIAESHSEKFEMTIAGKKIQCYKWGNSPNTIVVVHGWAGRATQFRRFVKPCIKAGYQIIGFDGPGHGQSDGKRTNLDEFENVLQKLVEKIGNVSAIVAHSFGGAASLYALTKGLPVTILANIASPTIGDEIINTYLRAIGGSDKTGEAFKKYILEKTGKSFDQFTALEFVKHVSQDLKLVLVHDEDDKDVTIDHPRALIKRFPQAYFLQTKKLGHTRILKDDHVIQSIVTFIAHRSSKL
jgi:esterase/lipase